MNKKQPPLFVPLKTDPYNAFKQGFKTHEIRLNGIRWNRNTCSVGRPVILSKGYGKHDRLYGVITSVDVFPAGELPCYEYADFVDCYGENRQDEDVIYIGIEIDGR